MKRINQFPNAPPDTFRARLACVFIGARIGGSAGSVGQDDGVTEDAARQNGAGEFWQTEPGWVLLDGGDGTYLPLLATQPIHARVANVAELRSALTTVPHLRPYLFHDTRGRLIPVWPDP
jgi:hypothetical protein